MSAIATPRYTADDITVLEGLEPVRKRPSMYIGGVGKEGLHHLVWEIIDNSVDEFINSYADHLTVTLHKSGDAVTVIDNGRGIPVDIHKKFKRPALEVILTTLHSGAKFGEGDNYFFSGGLHGVGSSVVNALSRKLIATIRRDGFEWQQNYRRGKPTTELQKVGPMRGHGTTIYFEPDPEIFNNTHFDPALIRARLEDLSYIHSGLKVHFKNEITGENVELTHEGGIPAFLAKLVNDKKTGDDPRGPVHDTPFHVARTEGTRIEVALQWTDATDESIRSYVNGIRTSDGGTHENGFRKALSRAVNNYIKTHDINVKGLDITAPDIREGVVAILSVFVREPKFQGQTKEKLNNEEMDDAVRDFVAPALEAWLNNNRTAADQIVFQIVRAARARLASREAANEVKRKSPTQRRLNLPGKLADCKASGREESELFLVEGDSAGGSAKQGRNNSTQAVLPLRGKILNSEGLTLNKALANTELNDLVSAIGTGAGDKFDLTGLRYGKIILLMDADADGYHITTLMLAFLFRHMPELIRKGHVYIAQPPLYKIDVGKETFWARDDAHKEEILSGLKANAKPEVSRFKGLGEMDAPVLGKTTLDPKNRTLLKVQIDSNLDADRVFVELLGKDPSQRYRFLMDSAQLAVVEDLDV
jgi:DNA gyrase/topoisomerase IV subunit B